MFNAFAVFGIKAEFKLDLGQLEKRYVQLQRKLHPDVRLDDKTSLNAAHVNLAYQILTDDLARAFHLLELNGISVESYKLSEIALAEIWEENELLEGLNCRSSIEGFIEKKRSKVQEIICRLEGINFPEGLNLFAAAAVELKYLSNLLKGAKARLNAI